MPEDDEVTELVEDDGGYCAVCGDLFGRGDEVTFVDGARRHVDDIDLAHCF